MIQKRNHNLTEVSKNCCHGFNWGQVIITGFTVTNSNLVLMAEPNMARRNMLKKLLFSVLFTFSLVEDVTVAQCCAWSMWYLLFSTNWTS